MDIKTQINWPSSDSAGLVWLGQAGFWVETGQHSILIDPYLSDSLAKKYHGKKHDHKRMMPAPCTVADLPKPDIVLITHAHTDHMDPETLAPLFKRFADVPFIVPSAVVDEAKKRINNKANLIGVNADQVIEPIKGLKLTILPAAHEQLKTNDKGQHFFLGYGIYSNGLKIIHTGDTIPYDGLDARIQKFAPNIALLPVNGRDLERLADGIPGNLTLQEALDLAKDIPMVIPHHWGMFAFNTIDPQEIRDHMKKLENSNLYLPICGNTLWLNL